MNCNTLPTRAFRSDFDRLFQDLSRSMGPWKVASSTSASAGPRLDVGELEDRYVVVADLPGRSLEDLEILVQDDTLTLKSTVTEKTDEDSKLRWLRRERTRGSFERSLRFVTAIEASDVTAKFTDGVLTVELPKSKATLPRRIQIEA